MKCRSLFLILLFFVVTSKSLIIKYTCSNVGNLQVYYDEKCSNGESYGCNAGGQGQNCRFCGFEAMPPCPSTTLTSTVSTATTTSSGPNTGTTTSGSIVTMPPSIIVQGPTPDWEKPPNPSKRKYVDHPLKKSSNIENHSGPIPTNSWYENLLMGTGESVVQMWPILIQAKGNGFIFSSIVKKADLVSDTRYVLQPFVADWIYKSSVSFNSKKVSNLKELSVTVKYYTGSGSMEIPLVTGMAFTTAIYNNLLPIMTTVRSILSVKVDNSQTFRVGDTTSAGNKFVISLNSGAYWVIYSSKPISFKITSNDISATSVTTTVLKTALLGANDNSDSWDRYSRGYVYSGDVKYVCNGNVAELQYIWNSIDSSEVLMYGLRHHLDSLKSGQKTGLKAFAIKGEMEAISGKTWTMSIPLSTISWNARNTIDLSKKQDVINALKADQGLTTTAPDPYWFGLELARSARLALIADELGEVQIAKNIRTNMINAFTPWLEGTNPSVLRYDQTYGGVVSSTGIADQNADYGNGYYNDHHFHYGYPVYAAAVIAKEDPGFLQKYSDEIFLYVRDFANPSNIDPYFPVTRNKDWFCWHSWAAGLYEFGDSRNQESTSEAINAFYAVSLLGKAANNQQLDDFGRLLTAMEVISTKAYWQMPSYSNIYPDNFKKNLMVGILWGTKVDYATFFGINDEFIHGIQFLPFTPITEEFLDKNFMQEEKPFLDKIVTTDDWMGYIIEAKAIVDKENQWTKAKSLQWYHAGSSKTNLLYWIATR